MGPPLLLSLLLGVCARAGDMRVTADAGPAGPSAKTGRDAPAPAAPNMALGGVPGVALTIPVVAASPKASAPARAAVRTTLAMPPAMPEAAVLGPDGGLPALPVAPGLGTDAAPEGAAAAAGAPLLEDAPAGSPEYRARVLRLLDRYADPFEKRRAEAAAGAGTGKKAGPVDHARRAIERYLEPLTIGMRQLDRDAGLKALNERFSAWLKSGGPKTAADIRDFMDNDMTNWPTHGQGHALQISNAIVGSVDRLAELGALKLPPSQAQALRVYGAYLGMIHDAGNFRAPRAPKESEVIRKSHDLVPAVLLFGGEIAGLEQQKQGFDRFLDDAAADPGNPLTKLLGEVADDPLIAASYEGSKPQRVRTLLKELLLGALSHGSLPGNPDLGETALAARRAAYLKQLEGAHPDQTKPISPSSLYRGGDWRARMMAWAEAGARRPEGHPIQALRRIFCLGEDLLNFADGNRARGVSVLSGPGGTQLIAYNDMDSGTIHVFAIKVDHDTGRKLVFEVASRQFGSLNVSALDFAGLDAAGNPKLRMNIVTSRFVPGSPGEKEAAAQTGRVIGETLGYMIRALDEDVFKGKTPKLEVVYPGARAQTPTFADAVEQAISASLAKVLARNGKIPASVAPEDVPRYVKDTYWDFKFVARFLPRRDPAQDIYARAAKHHPPTPKEVDALAKGVPLSKDVLARGGFVYLNPGEQFVTAGTSGGNTYLLIRGEVQGRPLKESGNPAFTVRGDGKVYGVLGGTIHLNGDPKNVRNATLRAGPAGATVLVIPEDAARDAFDAKKLATAPEDLPSALAR